MSSTSFFIVSMPVERTNCIDSAHVKREVPLAPPTWPVAGSGDTAPAVGLYSAIVTALYRRERTGQGQFIDISLLDSIMPLMGWVAANLLIAGQQAGLTVLVTAHGNSLRALVKHLDGISDDAIAELNIPTGIPLVYELDEKLQPLRNRYLARDEEVAAAQHAVAAQGKKQG